MDNDRRPFYGKWWFWTIIVVLLVAGVTGAYNLGRTRAPNRQGLLSSQTTPPAKNQLLANRATPLATIAPTPAIPPTDGMIKEGTYKIGRDLAAGEYLLIANNNAVSYYQVSKDNTGNANSVITNENFNGTRYLTMTDGQYLDLREAVMYPIAKAPTLGAQDGKYPEGMYKVGRDIGAGEYKVVPVGQIGSYYEIAKDSTGRLESIGSNDNFTTQRLVTLKNGEYIKIVSSYLTIK